MKTLLSWSSGKDSAWALHILRGQPDVSVVGLVTTVNEAFGRIAIHGVRSTLMDLQAAATGLPLHRLDLPWPCPNEAYERIMSDFVAQRVSEGIEAFAFGDLFLEDIRRYREQKLAGSGLRPLFPLWGRETNSLAHAMIAGGLEAHVVCLDPRKLPSHFAGRSFDRDFIAELPRGVDPCGENGEFHTFASAGPMFSRPIPVRCGEILERDGFVFCDLTEK